MLIKGIATYDPISPMSGCSIVKGSCKVGTRIFILAPRPKADCPTTDRLGKQDLLLHYHA